MKTATVTNSNDVIKDTWKLEARYTWLEVQDHAMRLATLAYHEGRADMRREFASLPIVVVDR